MGALDLQQLSSAALNQPRDNYAIEFQGTLYTWGQINHFASQIGSLMEQSGTDTTLKVALVAKNRPTAIAAYLELMRKGYSFRMLYPFQSSPSLAKEIEDIDPALVIADASSFDQHLVSRLKDKGIAAISLNEQSISLVTCCEQSLNKSATQTPATIEIHTSGTTGKPKPFKISYETIAKHIVGGRQTPSSTGTDPANMPPILMYFPLGNITGLHANIAPLLRGHRGVLLDRFNVEEWHDHLKRFRPIAGGLPPAGFQMVLDADLPKEDFSSLKMIGTGSAPLDPNVQKKFEDRHGVPVLLAYGATEFGGPVVTMTPDLYREWGQSKIGSVGKPLPGAKIRIVDFDKKELSVGEVGILEVISPRMGDGWITTADIAYLDDDGFLFLCGRADGAIMRGGFKVLPETIEKALLLHPMVAAAGVVGVEDYRLGQVPAAAIQIRRK